VRRHVADDGDALEAFLGTLESRVTTG